MAPWKEQEAAPAPQPVEDSQRPGARFHPETEAPAPEPQPVPDSERPGAPESEPPAVEAVATEAPATAPTPDAK